MRLPSPVLHFPSVLSTIRQPERIWTGVGASEGENLLNQFSPPQTQRLWNKAVITLLPTKHLSTAASQDIAAKPEVYPFNLWPLTLGSDLVLTSWQVLWGRGNREYLFWLWGPEDRTSTCETTELSKDKSCIFLSRLKRPTEYPAHWVPSPLSAWTWSPPWHFVMKFLRTRDEKERP